MEIHIGSIISRVAAEKKMGTRYLAEKLGMVSGSINRLYSYKSVQTEQLEMISAVLDYDFFGVFSEELNKKKAEEEVLGCEKMLAEKTAELEGYKKETAKEMEILRREMGYLKEINDLLRKKR